MEQKRYAFGVVLLPSPKVSILAMLLNARLKSRKIVLEEGGQLPHISLAMGVVEENKLASMKAALTNASVALSPVGLSTEIKGFWKARISEEEAFVGLGITRTGRLGHLQRAVMDAISKFATHDAELPDLFGPHPAPVTLTWVNGFREMSGDAFSPHITLGVGEKTELEDRIRFPFASTADTIALFHLGSLCTCPEEGELWRTSPDRQ